MKKFDWLYAFQSIYEWYHSIDILDFNPNTFRFHFHRKSKLCLLHFLLLVFLQNYHGRYLCKSNDMFVECSPIDLINLFFFNWNFFTVWIKLGKLWLNEIMVLKISFGYWKLFRRIWWKFKLFVVFEFYVFVCLEKYLERLIFLIGHL